MFLSDMEIERLYSQDFSCSKIARFNRCSETTMYKYMKSIGIQIRSRSIANKIFPDYIFIVLYNIGLSTSQIGKLLGINPSTITKRLHAIDFPLRSRDVACRIRYTDEEFKKYFMEKNFINYLMDVTIL